MEHKTRNVFLAFFVVLLFVYMVDFVKASVVRREESIAEEAYSDVGLKTTMMSTTVQGRSSRRRYMQEKDDTGQDICADIVGPTWMKKQAGKSYNHRCPTLDVWVPKKQGFTEFVKINEQSEVEGGFSIAIFCHALHLLPYNIKPIFRPFVNEKGKSNGTYNQLLEKLIDQTCVAVAGDVTVRGNRAQYVDFTIPYLGSEIYMLVPTEHEWNQSLMTFSRPFTGRLWITLIGACIFIGVAIAILEFRASNPKFTAPFHQKLIMVIWFPISTFYFQEGKILNRFSKVVLVMWLSMIFIVVQIYTATLSSWLTLDQLRPRLPSCFENVGYQDASFIKDFIHNDSVVNQYIHQTYTSCYWGNPVPLETIEDFKEALSNGSINAIFDELPYIDLFMAKYGSDYMKLGPIIQGSGIAFAFPRGSLLLEEFSRALINVTETSIMMEMKKKYMGFSPVDNYSQPNQGLPQSLDVQSFIALFIFMGTVSIAAIISSEISLMRRNSKILPLVPTVN